MGGRSFRNANPALNVQGGTISLARWVGLLNRLGSLSAFAGALSSAWTQLNGRVFPQPEIRRHSRDSEQPWTRFPRVRSSAARPRPDCMASSLNRAIRSRWSFRSSRQLVPTHINGWTG